MIERARVEIELEVDGGIDACTAPMVSAAGASVFVAGSSIFGSTEGIAAAMDRLGIAAMARDGVGVH